jgi:hypothetical protein
MKYNYRNKLEHLLQPGIYGILNNRNKSIYIGYGVNMLQSVSRQLDMIQSKTHSHFPHTTKVSSLQVFIIETCPNDLECLKLCQTTWADTYLAKGYKVLNTARLLRYKVKIKVDQDYNILVCLVSSNKKYKVINTFKHMQDAIAYSKLLEQEITQVYGKREQ